MLSVTDLLSLQSKPLEKDITLQTIQQFYKEHLCDRLFTFELDDEERPLVNLRFHEKDLCHLLGIHYVVQKLKNKYDYSGEKGYRKLKDGTVSFDFLKTTNKVWFKSKRNRMLYLPFIYQIVHSPSVIVFSAENLNTNLDVDIILYSHQDNTYLHLGVDKDADSSFYYPKSFYDRKKDDHIAGRKQLNVKAVKIQTD
ncbi:MULTISPECIES: PBECR4 domain-containing protein [Bacillaceae]|jgi:phage-Barnase-EndoU-ColicinE5/D-RelE like nuclease4|uniref:PBECR4 domain-containing protein n=1 Tax=Bacillaceae TaxID=186817 RepID=UPI0029651440|nr:PBECR4 domain-containing protein [Bacillus infantis]MDW2879682.1 PBECR4 domain-containing protein [Bacillus infantis]